MFLQTMRLTNIRSLPNVELDFRQADKGSRGWTYILGENGTGKSSVLRAIALVMAGKEALLELVAEPDQWIRLGSSQASISAIFATQSGDQRSASISFVRGQKVSEFISANVQSLEQIDAALEHSERNYFVVGYGVTRKPAAPDRHSFQLGTSIFRSPRARAMATLFSPEATLVPLESWAMDLEYRKGNSGTRAISRAMDALLPDAKFLRIDRDARRLLFSTPDGELPLSALSDGYQAMAAWCGDLLWQITETFQDYTDPLKARGLLLVDELDLHLHPVWQRQLVSFIKATLPNVQVVATTHSPLTVHQAGEGELYVLVRAADGGVHAEHYEGAPNKLMLHQLLQSPLFGLTTLDSPQVEEWRRELRSLQSLADKGEASRKQTTRLNELKRLLEDVPDWRQVQPYLQRTNEALERVAEALAASKPTRKSRTKASAQGKE